MSTEKFFTYLGRINAVGIFLVLVFLLVNFIGWFGLSQPWRGESYEQVEYGTNSRDSGIEGEEIETAGGGAVLYRTLDETQDRLEIEARNMSLTDRVTGRSRTVLPQGSEQLILSWDTLGVPPARDKKVAWVALAGTEQDYTDGILDLVLGRFSDLEQRTLARRLHFVDSPRLIDDSTMTLIAWPEMDRAEFWIVDLQTMSVASKRPVALPARAHGDVGEFGEDTAAETVLSID